MKINMSNKYTRKEKEVKSEKEKIRNQFPFFQCLPKWTIFIYNLC